MRLFLLTKLSIFAILLACVLNSCVNGSDIFAANESPLPILRDSNTAIVISNLDDSYRPGDRLPFDLNKEHVKLIDSLLLQSVASYNNSIESGSESLKIDIFDLNYKRQIIPQLGNNGEKRVCVNCFCSSKENWKRSIVIVQDGGKCYFKMWINLDDSKVDVFTVNGEG